MRCVSLAAIMLAGCGGGGMASLLQDSRLTDLLAAAKAELQRSSLDQNFKNSYIGACITPWADEGLVEAWIYASQHPDDEGRRPPDLEGTWRSVVPGGCMKLAQEGKIPLDLSCTQDITYSNQSNGQITQGYSIGGTTGMGQVAFTAGYGSGADASLGAVVVQSNHATGSGCSQEIINLLNFGPAGTWKQGYPTVRDVWSFNAILSSTCPAPKWQCVRMGLFKD